MTPLCKPISTGGISAKTLSGGRQFGAVERCARRVGDPAYNIQSFMNRFDPAFIFPLITINK